MKVKEKFLSLYNGSPLFDNTIIRENTNRFIEEVENGKRISLIKKPRAVGVTTMLIDYSIISEYDKVLYVVNDYDIIPSIIQSVSKGIERLGIFKSVWVTDINKVYTSFIDNKYDLIIFDEFTNINDDKLFKTLNFIQENSNSKVIISSIPYEKKGLFYELCSTSEHTSLIFSGGDALASDIIKFSDEPSIKRQIFAEFSDNIEIKIKKLKDYHLDEMVYELMLERIDTINKENESKLTPSEYLNELVKRDVLENIKNI